MLEERVLYLVNAEIDGELAPGERAELESVLNSSAEARSARAELQGLASLIADLPEQPPPSDLVSRVLGQIRLPDRRAPVASKFALKRLLSAFHPATAGLAFAAGLLLTVGLYEAAQRGGEPADLPQVVGSMVANPAAGEKQKRDSLAISGPGLSGTVSLGDMGEFKVLSFDLESEQQTEIVVGLAESGLGFGGIAYTAANGNEVSEFYEVSRGTLRVVNRGRQAFSVFLLRLADPAVSRAVAQDAAGGDISIGISTDGESVFSTLHRG